MKSMTDTLKKAMSTMFAPVDNVKYDLASGQTGIVTDGGLVILGSDGVLDQNPMDFFSLELPAFAMLTPAKDIQKGDIIVSGGKAYGFILEPGLKPAPRGRAKDAAVDADPEADMVAKGELQTMNVQGHVSRFRPKRVTMMGVTDGLLVVRSFTNLFGQQGAEQAAQNPMQAMLPLMLMSKGGYGSGDMKSLLPLMMMGGMGGGNMMSNPLMMMALLGDGGIDGLFK